MTDLQVIDLARSFSAKFDIHFDERKVLQNMHTRVAPITTIVSRGDVTIWIDRHYISFSRNDDFNAHYVYMSRTHIKEEFPNIIKRLKNVKSMNDYVLLTGIKLQMRQALAGMNASGNDDYIFTDYGDGEGCVHEV